MESIRVLIPTDFSVQAEYAFILVNNIAKKTNCEIHFLHVLNVPDTVSIDASGSIQTCGEIDINYVQSQKEIAERKIAELKERYGEHISGHITAGKVKDSIVNYAEQNNFHLIAIGTKGAWGLKESISGTLAQMLARSATIPVLSLMCDRSDLEINNIVLVHNFSESKKQDFFLLHKLIAVFSPKLHLLQISTHKKDDKQTILNNMKMFASLNDIDNYDTHILEDTDVEKGVIHFNQMKNMDIVCIGTHGKGGFLHSSATEKLINHMFKPILSFHLK